MQGSRPWLSVALPKCDTQEQVRAYGQFADSLRARANAPYFTATPAAGFAESSALAAGALAGFKVAVSAVAACAAALISAAGSGPGHTLENKNCVCSGKTKRRSKTPGSRTWPQVLRRGNHKFWQLVFEACAHIHVTVKWLKERPEPAGAQQRQVE